MEIKFDKIDFPIDITSEVIDRRNLTVKKHDTDHQIAFRIDMDGYTLVRVYDNGDIVLHTHPYEGRDYHYERTSSGPDPGEVRYRLVPSKKEVN